MFKNMPFQETKIGRDIADRQQFMQEITAKTGKKINALPQVFVDGKHVGDFKATARHFQIDPSSVP